MSEINTNCITKWAIVVVSAILGAASGWKLYLKFTDGNDMDSTKILGIVYCIAALVLCVLCCYGAITENSTLCCIAFICLIVILVWLIWQVVECFIKDNYKCEVADYLSSALAIIVVVVLVFCVYAFIQSIKR